MPRVGYL